MQNKSYAMSIVAVLVLAGCAERNGGGPGGDEGDEDALVLQLGTMMPITGGLSNLGGSMQNGAKLAIEDVNSAGKGVRIEVVGHEDDRTSDSTAAPNTFNRLVSRGAQGVAGPCCSGVTGAVLELAVQNQVVVASPSATSPALTSRDNEGYFWRIAPSDAIQGRVLADLVKGDNVTTANMIIINNPYGNGLASVFRERFATNLGGVVTKVVSHDEDATTFSSQVDEACLGAGTPALGAIVLVTYTDQGAQILREMNAKGCLSKVRVYASEGLYDQAGSIATKAGDDAQGAKLAGGMKGTSPQDQAVRAYLQRYEQVYGTQALQYSAESYDAVVLQALAALSAGSERAADYRNELREITSGGTKCDSFAECADLLADGGDIDYVGAAHDFEFNEKHEPTKGVYIWWEVQEDGTMRTIAEGKSA